MIDEHTAHLEKIAIHEKYLRSGLGDLLMKEMMQRVKNYGATHLTIGFMKTEFFKRFSFKTDESFAGLVKEL
jgi:N-acetylglutamate synthase-like GNAT family acetyltransferase